MTEIFSGNSELLITFSLGFLFALFFVGLVGRTPAIFTRLIARIIRIPFSIIALFFRAIRQPRIARSLLNTLLDRRRGITSEIEKELQKPIEDDDSSDSKKVGEHYDFAEEETYFRREGWFFRSIRVPEGYVPVNLTAKLSEEIADDSISNALRFFNGRVPTVVDGKALYEDAEGAIIISMFKRSDLRCFYALNEMRKTINQNALRVVALFSGLFILVNSILVWISMHNFDGLGHQFPFLPDFLIEHSSSILSLSTITAYWLMLIFIHGGGYEKQQKNATRELGLLMNRYMDRINDRFRDARTKAMGVTVGEEKDTKKVANSARKWFTIMVWMPFRAFFIESFFRNIRFQIERNKSYYLLIPWAVLLLGILIVVYFNFVSISLKMDFTKLVLFVSMIFSAVLYYFYINKEVIGLEIKQSNWFGFENLEIGHAMEEVVGKYAEEVGYWKNRLDR